MSVSITNDERGTLLETRTRIAAPLDLVFAFFSDARNLEAITPPSLRFRIVTPKPIVMGRGTLIDYRLRLHGVPLRWRSEISSWNPPHGFVDRQLRGPYRWWVHEHAFHELDGGTIVEDRVRFGVPGGSLVRRLLVEPDLRRIFTYRRRRVRELLAG